MAGAVIADLARRRPDAFVSTTVCDQLRRGRELMDAQRPVFLMNVPSTWATETARTIYLDELRRLGKFLERIGGYRPDDGALAAVMRRFDAGRDALRARIGRTAFGDFAGRADALPGPDGRDDAGQPDGPPSAGPLLVLSAHLRASELSLIAEVERAGGRVAIDATEFGLRGWPRPFDPARLEAAPLDELAEAYWSALPDPSRRPNDRFLAWIGETARDYRVAGVICLSYVWCDLWRAEVPRMREAAGAPFVNVELSDDPRPDKAMTRLLAFLEGLT